MVENPYKYHEPLVPTRDKLVCIPRKKDIDRVAAGTLNGDYWTILGSSQMGKTTFLRLLMRELSFCHCLYIDLELTARDEDKFYMRIMSRIIKGIESENQEKHKENWGTYGPELDFLDFLESFKPKKDKKIILLFDNIEKTNNMRSFLLLWRKVFNERYQLEDLAKYSVVIAGRVDLNNFTRGATSPFNIAKKMELMDFTREESDALLEKPFKSLGVQLQTGVKERIYSYLGGHPQILQQLCTLLVNQMTVGQGTISLNDVEATVERLFIESGNLRSLDKEIRMDNVLAELGRNVLAGEKKPYMPYKDLALTGTGPIVNKNNNCAIRNRMYERVFKNIEEQTYDAKTPIAQTFKPVERGEYTVDITLKETLGKSPSEEELQRFIKCLLDPGKVRIQVLKNGSPLKTLELKGAETLIFCYMAFENHKAIINGDNPSTSKYHLSSVPSKNTKQEPEWSQFVEQAIGLGITSASVKTYSNSNEPNGAIRAHIFAMRKKIKVIGAEGLIPKQIAGGGKGYYLQASVLFSSSS